MVSVFCEVSSLLYGSWWGQPPVLKSFIKEQLSQFSDNYFFTSVWKTVTFPDSGTPVNSVPWHRNSFAGWCMVSPSTRSFGMFVQSILPDFIVQNREFFPLSVTPFSKCYAQLSKAPVLRFCSLQSSAWHFSFSFHLWFKTSYYLSYILSDMGIFTVFGSLPIRFFPAFLV